MRKLLFITVGFAAACIFCVYCVTGFQWFWLSALLMLLALVLLSLGRNKGKSVLALLLLGCGVGFMWFSLYDILWLQPAREADGTIRSVTLEATDYSYETTYGSAADGVIEIAGRSYAVRFYINQRVSLSPGDHVSGEFRLRYTAPGGKEKTTYHSGIGTLLLAYPSGDVEISEGDGNPVRYMPAQFREILLKLVERIFPEDIMPFIKALLLGDTYDMDYQTETSLMISGIRHVAAVSGLHVSILFSLVYVVTGKRGFLSAIVGIPVLVLFAAMAGFSPSVMRACMMQALMLIAMAAKREYDAATALSFAVLVMMVLNPLVITSVGFQLSVASVVGILAFAKKISGWLLSEKRFGKISGKTWKSLLIKRVVASVSVSLSTMITTMPLCAWYFGCVSLFSVVTNLLCLWVVTLLFCGAIIVCIVGLLYPPAGSIMAWLVSWMARYILAVSDCIAKIPLAAVYTESVYIVVWLVFCYALLVVFLILRKKRPIIFSSCVIFGLVLALVLSWVEPQLDHYRVTILDVGQGQCVLLQSEGRTYMVDCGGGDAEEAADKAAAHLLTQGITRLDGLILTHYDKDHVGAAAYLLSRIDTDTLILPVCESKDYWEQGIIPYTTGTILRGDEDIRIAWGSAVIQVFSSQNVKDNNESSLCVLFQAKNCDILITGDRSAAGEAALLRTGKIPELDVLIVGHHGAKTSTSDFLLEQTKPKFAAISVGADNSYGHPSELVLDRCAKYGCIVRRTDLEGTIIFRG